MPEEPASAPVENPQTNTTPTPQDVSKPKSLSGVVVLCAIVALIIVGGILAFIYRGPLGDFLKGVPKSSNIDNPVKPGTSSEIPSDWRTYSTSDQSIDFTENFTVKLPKSWGFTVCEQDNVWFFPTKPDKSACGIDDHIGFRLATLNSNYDSEIVILEKNFTKSGTKVIDGKTALKFTKDNENKVSYIIKISSDAFLIEYDGSTSGTNYSKELDQILSTFKFL